MVLHCQWGTCTGDRRYPERIPGGKMHLFPSVKTKREEALVWIKACGRPHYQLNIDRLSKNTGVCAGHFVGGKGPTKEHPYPVPVPTDGSRPKSNPRSSRSKRKVLASDCESLRKKICIDKIIKTEVLSEQDDGEEEDTMAIKQEISEDDGVQDSFEKGMAPPTVFVTRKVHDEAVKLMKQNFDVESWDSEEVIPQDVLLQKVKGKDAIFCTISDTIDTAVLDAAGPQLKIVGTMSVGTHHIDTFQCKKRGVFVSTTADVSSDSAAEMTVCLLLMTARRCLEGVDAVNKGTWGLWKPMWICGVEFSGRTLGILGFGRVGFGVARRMKPFGLSRILYNDVTKASMADDLSAEFVDKDTLYKESDFLIVTCPFNGATINMINKAVFAKMKPTAILINTSRGPIVNTNDLVDALTTGQIAAAGLDVTDPQPLPPSHPLVSMPNCVITPHLGTNSTKAREAMAVYTAKNIVSFIRKPM